MKRYGILTLICIGIVGLMSCDEDTASLTLSEATPVVLSGSIENHFQTRNDDGETEWSDETLPTITQITYSSIMQTEGAPIFHFAQFAQLSQMGQVTFRDGEEVPNYPMSGDSIRMVLHTRTGTFPRDDYMEDNRKQLKLHAGNSKNNDYLLGNNGYGTKATSSVKISLHHIMTRINVTFTKHDDVLTLPQTATLRLKGNALPKSGSFPIESSPGKDNYKATPIEGSNMVALRAGYNYVLATGNDLTGVGFNEITIDDYTLTENQVNAHLIPVASDGSGEHMVLEPGVSYTLNFHIGKVGIVGLSIYTASWDIIDINTPESNHLAQRVVLNLGEYDKTDIEKIVVFDEKNKKYTAAIDSAHSQQQGLANRITNSVQIPATIKYAEIYTAKGMIINTDRLTYSNDTLSISLSKSGMKPVNPDEEYDSINNPYAITTPIQLFKIEDLPNATFRQVVDLDLRNTPNRSIMGEFTGRYDGNNKHISYLLLNDNGLFYHNNGIIENLYLKSGIINATEEATHVGTIATINSGQIIACVNNARIKNVSETNSSVYIGGLCGKLTGSGLIIGCLQSGAITSSSGTAAGFVGEIDSKDAKMTACVNVAKVASKTIFALCGNINSAEYNEMELCYWLAGTATIGSSATESAVGGYSDDQADGNDLCALSTDRLKENATINRLNNKLNEYNITTYRFELLTWPTAVKTTN